MNYELTKSQLIKKKAKNMSYTTLEQIQTIIPNQELANLTNDDRLTDEINAGIVNSAICYADELINTYLRNKYVLPLKSVPQIIVNISTDITAFRLYSRRPQRMPEHIQNRYDEAIKILSNIKKEEMILDLPSEHPETEVTPPSKMVVTNKSNESRKFGDGVWNSFGL